MTTVATLAKLALRTLFHHQHTVQQQFDELQKSSQDGTPMPADHADEIIARREGKVEVLTQVMSQLEADITNLIDHLIQK